MELCSLTDAARQNVAQTYMGLARNLPNTRLIQHPNFSGTIALLPYAFCNFVIGIDGDDSELGGILHEIDRWARLQPALRVYVLSGDGPHKLEESLVTAGFSPVHRLIQMAWYPARTLGREEWSQAQSSNDRRRVSSFMVQQFFAMNAAEFRELVVEATTQGPHELWQINDDDSIVATAMVSETQHALGIYNVCVESTKRRRGYGTALMRSAQIQAQERQLPLLLQCDEALSGWYRELGFQVFGEMHSFQRRI